MITIACDCDGLPAHDHHMGFGFNAQGVYAPIYDANDVGRVWVNWKDVARALATQPSRHSAQAVPDASN